MIALDIKPCHMRNTMMRLVQMIWQVLMILISVYIGWLFIRCMRRYSSGFLHGIPHTLSGVHL